MAIHAWHIMKERISAGPDASAREVAMKIVSSGFAAMPVVGQNQELLGVVSENAILDIIRSGQDMETVSAANIMVPAPIVVNSDATTDELITRLLESCCSVVTVVKDGKYVGVVTRHMMMDIFTSPHYSRFASRDRKAPFACL